MEYFKNRIIFLDCRIPIILAIVVNEVANRRFKKTVQMVTYDPCFIVCIVEGEQPIEPTGFSR